jgi:hypothetical protein
MDTIFQAGKRSMMETLDGYGRGAACPEFLLFAGMDSSLILDRLALGPHVRNHRPENAHPDTWRDFEFELRVVHNSRHFADQASGRDHAIAPARILNEIGMFLRLFALRPDDKKIRDGKDHHEGHQLH